MDCEPHRTSTGVAGEVDKEIVDASVDFGRVALVKASSDDARRAAMRQVEMAAAAVVVVMVNLVFDRAVLRLDIYC